MKAGGDLGYGDFDRFEQCADGFDLFGRELWRAAAGTTARARAAVRPAKVLLRIRFHSNSVSAAKTWKISRPAGKAVSIFSASDSKLILRFSRSLIMPTRSASSGTKRSRRPLLTNFVLSEMTLTGQFPFLLPRTGGLTSLPVLEPERLIVCSGPLGCCSLHSSRSSGGISDTTVLVRCTFA